MKVAELVHKVDMITWDEAPMMHAELSKLLIGPCVI
jgi:hypothetical protein